MRQNADHAAGSMMPVRIAPASAPSLHVDRGRAAGASTTTLVGAKDAPPFSRTPYSSPGTARRPSTLRRSEEHTSELQSRRDLVCRLLLEKKKRISIQSAKKLPS